MTTAQTEGLIGMLFVLGILVLLVAPAVTGVIRDRRIERQIKEAELDRAGTVEPRARRERRGYFTTTVTHHS